MSLGDVTSARSSPAPEACPECDTSASVTSDLHKYQVACTCKPASVQYACADDPGPPPPAKTDTPPALPPRPPTSVLAATNRRNNASVGCNGNEGTCRRRKYAWWCVGCGALAAALGGLLAAQHILLRAYTASPQHLETVPAAVPAAMVRHFVMVRVVVRRLRSAGGRAGRAAGGAAHTAARLHGVSAAPGDSLAAALGGLLAAQHILLRAYTASPQHLETVPAAVPAAMVRHFVMVRVVVRRLRSAGGRAGRAAGGAAHTAARLHGVSAAPGDCARRCAGRYGETLCNGTRGGASAAERWRPRWAGCWRRSTYCCAPTRRLRSTWRLCPPLCRPLW
ncbi:hypothetical protein PYW07_011650 [Mythimna separata]|uniref:Uncharacterized protein n=1 Tax=Mythimna separata TaxID=271217 RepID=A0AAD7Y6H5_MYTSE|nr:hypothetical protein PYW07_011650 [Mythimna separata]